MRDRKGRWGRLIQGFLLAAAGVAASAAGCAESQPAAEDVVGEAREELQCSTPISAEDNATQLIHQGRNIFRYDTFGDERFWGDKLHLHLAIAGAANGGFGPGLSPAAALALGLKVDVDALPRTLQDQIRNGQVNLQDPAVTVALLRLDAVVGVRGFFNNGNGLKSVGIQCALCHSIVDDSLAPGIGRRLDGWANRDLNVGAVVALAPELGPLAAELNTDVATVRRVLLSWGPGKFDAQLLLDGKAFRPDGKSAAVLLPPAFGLAGVNLHTWTGWGSVPYWNAFVANIPMHGIGRFEDSRLDDPVKYPLAAARRLGHIKNSPDLITSKLPPLHVYQLVLAAPTPAAGTFDAQAAARGERLFKGRAKCANCHVPPIFTEPGWNMHTGAEIGIDEFQAMRAPDERYRTPPLRGLFTHQKGGFYHDGRFATLEDVVEHYNRVFSLGLTPAEKADLVEYLKSI